MRKVRINNYTVRDNQYIIYFDQLMKVSLTNRQAAAKTIAGLSDFFTREVYAISMLSHDLDLIKIEHSFFISPDQHRYVSSAMSEANSCIDYLLNGPYGPNFNTFVLTKINFALKSYLHVLNLFRQHFKRNSNTSMVYKTDYLQERVKYALSIRQRLEEKLQSLTSNIEKQNNLLTKSA